MAYNLQTHIQVLTEAPTDTIFTHWHTYARNQTQMHTLFRSLSFSLFPSLSLCTHLAPSQNVYTPMSLTPCHTEPDFPHGRLAVPVTDWHTLPLSLSPSFSRREGDKWEGDKKGSGLDAK